MALCITLLSVMLFSTLATGQDKEGWLNDRVTIRFQEKPMSIVLGKISQKTGIAILYDENLSNQKVTGHYKDIKFSEAIDRLFSEKNKSIQVFKNEKKIIVKTFGAKQFILAPSGETVPGKSSGKKESISVADLEKIHRQQYKEYKEWLADNNEVLDGGMTRGEIKALHESQYKDYKKHIDNPNELVDQRMTRGELKALHDRQAQEYRKYIANDDEVLDGGMTRGAIKAMHKRQAKEFKKYIANDNEILEGGMTRGEIRLMHQQQLKEISNERDKE
ncbi:MAG: hypothetical protein D3925_10910 [Candidatus Electrothrix sp. AR5]|nr:hypothetical protein [Candidatus Electrothrix sp. AR5]